MSDMDEVQWTKVYIAWGFTVGLVLLAVVAAIWHYNWATNKAAFDAGLEECQLQGQQGVYWVHREKK